MAKINNISFNNFRNFINYRLSFDHKLNIFFGKNGCGKTNILEGLSLISKGRGIRNSNIFDLIKKKERFFYIKNQIEIQNNNYDIEIFTEKKEDKFKKIIKINDDLSKDSLDFLNNSVSYLIFLPEMERLFQASPSYRRNFLDRLIFSSKNNYNTLINKYKKFLLERTKLLQKYTYDNNWLNHLESTICSLGMEIYEARNSQIDSINSHLDILKQDHKFQFDVKLTIKDSFFKKNTSFEEYLLKIKDLRAFDKKFGGSSIGPHRSDLLAIINNDLEASILSTGQQKTVVLMIILAQCNFLIKNKSIEPILLFDEIASHLDSNNRQILLDMINKFKIQFFLTGTDKSLFSFISTNAKFYNITET